MCIWQRVLRKEWLMLEETLDDAMYNLVGNTVPADDLAMFGARITTDTLTTKFKLRIVYVRHSHLISPVCYLLMTLGAVISACNVMSTLETVYKLGLHGCQ